MLGGVLSVLAVMTKGFGPCGPDSALGTFLLLGGTIAFIVGIVTVIVALAWTAIRQRTTHG